MPFPISCAIRSSQSTQSRHAVPFPIKHTTTEQRCETVYDKSEKQVGYSVRYRLGDQEKTIKMNHDPGDRIPVRDGQLVLDDAAGSKENTGSKDKKS